MIIAMARSAFVSGPARIVRGAASFFSKDDITVKLDPKTFNIETSAHGKIDERFHYMNPECSFTPDGRWDAATIAALWPYASTLPGADIYGDTDIPLVLHGSAGELFTIEASANVKMPDINFSATKSLIGPCQFVGVQANNTDIATNSASVSYAPTGGSFTDAAFAASLIKTQPYTCSVSGVDGLTSFQSEDGFQAVFETNIEEKTVDSLGVFTRKFKSAGLLVKCKPVGPTLAQLLAAMKFQGSGAQIGRSYAATGAALTIVGADGITYLTVPLATLKTGGFKFGSTVLRNDEVGFVAARSFSAGTYQPLFTMIAS